MKNKHGSTHSQTRRTIPMDSQIPRQNIWTLSRSFFVIKKYEELLIKIPREWADMSCSDAVVIFIFILFQVFSSGPLFALPYCHQFLAPIKTILSWHHKITFFCRWTFPVSFWDKTCVDNSGTLVYTGEQRCGIYQSTPNHQKTWHVQRTFYAFKCYNWISSFPHTSKATIFGRLSVNYCAVMSE